MEPPFKPWQPYRGIIVLIVVVFMAMVTFLVATNPLSWVLKISEYNMVAVLYLVFLLFFTGKPFEGGWFGNKLREKFGPRVPWPFIFNTIFLLVFVPITFWIFENLVGIGPSFPWILFFTIQCLYVFLTIALFFNNWPLQRLKQPYQSIGLLILALVVGWILYRGFHDYTAFYEGAKAVPPEVLAVLLPKPPGPWLEAINPHGMVDGFLMATMNTMFILYLCIIFFLFDMWPFRLLKKQPWIGLSATAFTIILSIGSWYAALAIYPQIVMVDLGLLAKAGFAPPEATGLVPLAALPPPAITNIVMLHVLGAFEGPLIFATLIWSAIFMWWPTLHFSALGRQPYNRQPVKGFLLLVLVIITAAIAYYGMYWVGMTIQPPIAWQVPGMIPPPYYIFLWLVICWLPGFSVYTVYYAVACEAWPQPPTGPPPPDITLQKPGKPPVPLTGRRKEDLKAKYLYSE